MHSSKRYWGFVKDPVYGYIRLTDSEKNIIDTRPFQRLRRIKQLAVSYLVYPAANHTRFEHSLGAMHLAGILGESLPIELDNEFITELRLASLLHDIGHGPLSHLFEPLLSKYVNKNHEDMTFWLIQNSILAETLKKEGFDPERISKLAVGRLKDGKYPFLDQVIRSSVDVDKMDFIVRDSYHTGAGYGYVDVYRLIYTMDILNDNLAIDITALSAFEAFLLARLESFKAIYFHRTSRAAQITLLKAMENAMDELKLFNFNSPEDYLKLDDYSIWYMLKKSSQSKAIMKLENRELLKCAYEKTFFDDDQLVTSIFNNEAVRKEIEEEIANKAKIDSDLVTIDIPSLPSVPYHYAIDIEPMNIPTFRKDGKGNKIPQKITELSRIIESLGVFMNIIRVYTESKYREKIRKASQDVLGKTPLSSLISY
ncbi:MAG: HD domain-containing protein [Candidatus Bathyarchaeota archaeon]|nr:HD domain-containing protein [Candidatus Bathyarchaeota archaeon]